MVATALTQFRTPSRITVSLSVHVPRALDAHAERITDGMLVAGGTVAGRARARTWSTK